MFRHFCKQVEWTIFSLPDFGQVVWLIPGMLYKLLGLELVTNFKIAIVLGQRQAGPTLLLLVEMH